MATINETIDENDNKVFNVEMNQDENELSLATANTYVDKNIIFKITPGNPEETGAFAIRYNTDLMALEIVNAVNLEPDEDYITEIINKNGLNVDSIEDTYINNLG